MTQDLKWMPSLHNEPNKELYYAKVEDDESKQIAEYRIYRTRGRLYLKHFAMREDGSLPDGYDGDYILDTNRPRDDFKMAKDMARKHVLEHYAKRR